MIQKRLPFALGCAEPPRSSPFFFGVSGREFRTSQAKSSHERGPDHIEKLRLGVAGSTSSRQHPSVECSCTAESPSDPRSAARHGSPARVVQTPSPSQVPPSCGVERSEDEEPVRGPPALRAPGVVATGPVVWGARPSPCEAPRGAVSSWKFRRRSIGGGSPGSASRSGSVGAPGLELHEDRCYRQRRDPPTLGLLANISAGCTDFRLDPSLGHGASLRTTFAPDFRPLPGAPRLDAQLASRYTRGPRLARHLVFPDARPAGNRELRRPCSGHRCTLRRRSFALCSTLGRRVGGWRERTSSAHVFSEASTLPERKGYGFSSAKVLRPKVF